MSPAGGVVACPEPLAAEAGAEMLRKGGNAVDAAIAAAFAQGVVDPMMCGLSGGAGFLIHVAATGESWFLFAGGYAPRKATPGMWANRPVVRQGATWSLADRANRIGYQASLVPGFVRGAEDAFLRFGSGALSWAELLEPAIRYAEDGFEVYPYLWNCWRPGGRVSRNQGSDDPRVYLAHNDAAAEIFLPNDRVPELGERFVQRDHGRTLRRIAEGGAAAFYEGEIAGQMEADFAANGGLLTREDLRGFRSVLVPALEGRYHDLQVRAGHPPGLGPIAIELFQILEGYDLAALGWNSPEYLDLIARAMQMAFKDRLIYMTDPNFQHVPVEMLISREYAARVRELIDSGEDRRVVREAAPVPSNTTTLSVVDGHGNAVGLNHSINTGAAIVTPGLGFLHNNRMWGFNPEPGHHNSIAAGKAPLQGGGPCLLVKDGQIQIVLGSPGGSRGTTSAFQAVANVLHFGMSLQRAMEVPRIHSEDQAATIFVESSFDRATARGLEALGNRLIVSDYTGRLAGVRRHPGGRLEGGSDPRADRGLAVVEPGQ